MLSKVHGHFLMHLALDTLQNHHSDLNIKSHLIKSKHLILDVQIDLDVYCVVLMILIVVLLLILFNDNKSVFLVFHSKYISAVKCRIGHKKNRSQKVV